MLSTPEKLVFRELSADSRMSASELSRKLKISRYNAEQLVKSVEQKLRLRYTLELDYKKLGFSAMHIMYLKLAKKPKNDVLKSILSKSTRIQFFATAKGDFDLMAIALTRDPIEYSQLELAFQIALIDYGAEVKSAEVTKMRFGFVPLLNPIIGLASIDETYKKVLSALNENSRAQLNELAKELHINENMLNYYTKHMFQEGIIKRFTAIATYPFYNASFAAFMNYQIRSGVLSRIERERHELYFSEPDELPVINNVQNMWNIIGSAQAFLTGSFETSRQCNEFVNKHIEIYKQDRPECAYADIKDVLVGYLPARNLDMKSTYDTTGWPLELI